MLSNLGPKTCYLLSMLVASNLAPWGPSSDAGGLGSTWKETLEFQAWIPIDLGRILEPPFGRFWPTLAQQLCFNQEFGVEGIAKTSFSHMSGLCRCWCHFYMVFDGSGTNFDDFWWPGARLETL